MIKARLQMLSWAKDYNFGNLRFDLLAGITLAAYVLPESMAYAGLAGMPPQAGIYAVMVGGLLFALFTTTRQVVVAPTSSISLMVASSVAVLSAGDPGRWVAIASLAALGVSFIYLMAWIFKLSAMVSFISDNVLLGFKAGAALSIISTQLPKLFGVEGGGANFFIRIGHFFQAISETNLYILAFGLVAILLLQLGHHFLPGKPVSLLIMVGSIIIFSTTNLAEYGFQLCGEIAGGFPPLKRPSLRLIDVDGIFGLALGCFLLGYVETVSVSRTFAEKYHEPVNQNRELLALGAANFGAAFTGGYPMAGGLSQSVVNDKAGAKTPLSLVISSVVLLLIMLFFTHLMTNLPEVVLAALVITAVLGLIKVKELKKLYYLSRKEFGIAILTVIAVLFLGILKGVLITALFSLIVIIIEARHAAVPELGLIPGTRKFSDLTRNPANERLNHVKVFRIESAILYFNEESIAAQIIEQTADMKDGLVVLDLSAAPRVDVAGGKMLLSIAQNLKAKNVSLKIVDALGSVRDLLRKLGMEEQIGHINRKDSIYDVIESYYHKEA